VSVIAGMTDTDVAVLSGGHVSSAPKKKTSLLQMKFNSTSRIPFKRDCIACHCCKLQAACCKLHHARQRQRRLAPIAASYITGAPGARRPHATSGGGGYSQLIQLAPTPPALSQLTSTSKSDRRPMTQKTPSTNLLHNTLPVRLPPSPPPLPPPLPPTLGARPLPPTPELLPPPLLARLSRQLPS